MTNTERRQAERASLVRHYRANYETVGHETLADGSEVYLFTLPALGGKVYGMAFAGTAGKHSGHYSFRTLDRAQTWAAEFIAGRTAHAALVQGRRAERHAFRTTLKAGDVLDASWGYDQTNVDFYQVVEVSGSGQSVTLRPIAARSVEDGAMQGVCWPLADEFTGEPETHRVLPGDSVKVRDWGVYASKWEPRPVRWTAYA